MPPDNRSSGREGRALLGYVRLSPTASIVIVVTDPRLPAFADGCVTNIVPYLLAHSRETAELPAKIGDASQSVLFVLDGLGWDQLQDRLHLAPTLASMDGGKITTVAPSTTAAALTSITTTLSPAEHGVVGYRMRVDGSVLNTLRWWDDDNGDARRRMPPDLIQGYEPFRGEDVPVVTKSEFNRTGFTQVHLRGGRLRGYRTPAVLISRTAQLLRDGEPFVYTYWDGVDKVSHEFGFGAEFDAEIAFADRMVADLIAAVPSGTQVVITADHGQVDCRNGLVEMSSEVHSLTTGLSGEGRFRWLHTDPSKVDALAQLCDDLYGHQAWVRTIDQILDEKWFGPSMTPQIQDRLGQVALCPFEPIAYSDPADTGPFQLVGRHGSLTDDEMLVPLLVAHV